MAASRRPMDVPKERVLERPSAPHHAPKSQKKGTSIVPFGNQSGKQSDHQISPSAAISM